MLRRIIVGIDIGTTVTRVVVSELEKGSSDPVVLGVGSAPTRGMRHGYITSIPDVVESLADAKNEAESQSGMKIKRAFVAVGGISLQTLFASGSAIISRADNQVTDLDIDKAIKEAENTLDLANKRILYRNTLSIKLDGKDILGRALGLKGVKIEVRGMFVASHSQHLDDLIAVVIENGIEVIDVIPAPIAAGAIALTERQRTVGCALVNIGAETVSLSVFENNTAIGLHIFGIGSTDITNDIALGLRIPLDEAEHIKLGTQNHTYSRKKLDDIIEARLGDIFELVENYLKKIKRNGLLPAGIILTGGGSGLPMIEEISKGMLRLPTRIATGEIVTIAKGKMRDASWFVPYGLCMMALEYPGETAFLGDKNTFSEVSKGLSSFFKQLLP